MSLGIYITDRNVEIKNRDKPFKITGRNLVWVSGDEFYKYIRLYF